MSTPKDLQSILGKGIHPVERFANKGPEADPSNHPRAERRSSVQVKEEARNEAGRDLHFKPE